MLFQLFYGQAVRSWGLYIISTTVGILILDHFGADFQSLLLGVFVTGYLINMFQFSNLIPVNLPWIMALPLSKRKILIFNYFFSWALIFTFVLSFFGVTVLATFIKTGQVEFLTHFLSNRTEYLNSIPLWMHHNSTLSITLVCIAMSMLHGISMVRQDPVTARLRRMNIWQSRSRRTRLVISLGVAAGLILSALFFKSYFSGFSFMIAICIYFVIVPVFTASAALSMSRNSYRRLLTGSIIFVLFLVAITFRTSAQNANDTSNPQRIFSVVFLGPFAQGVSRTSIAGLLETDLV